jgi:hypothetical protein
VQEGLADLHRKQETTKGNDMRDIRKFLKETPLSELREMQKEARLNLKSGGKSWNDRVLVTLPLQSTTEEIWQKVIEGI